MANKNTGYNLSEVATAPYNFVKLNDVVVKPPLAEYIDGESTDKGIISGYKEFLKDGEKISGYFDVTIKNISPFYIAGQDGFFSDGATLCIPGSSFRGLMKNTLKIISNGRMNTAESEDVEDKILYYRNFSSNRKIRELYIKEMENVKPGILVKLKGADEYCIFPAEMEKVEYNGGSRDSLPKIVWNNDSADIYTGYMNGKKHYYHFYAVDWQNKITVGSDIVKYYSDDLTRKGIDLINDKQCRRHKGDGCSLLDNAPDFCDYMVPCFYAADKNKAEHFGAGRFYRIPYKKSIGDHIPSALKTEDIDFASAIFGNKEYWSSRVFFEDLYIDDNDYKTESGYPKVLEAPKPTSFQNYLEPGRSGEAMHWNDSANIRGYKLYWHKNPDWKDRKNDNENYAYKISPLIDKKEFNGKVRFESLDAVELGALCSLFLLGEEKGIRYKMGMGKPLGMGSVEVSGDLYIYDDTYYTALFSENGLDAGVVQVEKNLYANKFNQYMQSHMEEKSQKLHKQRMDELRTIMSTANKTRPNWSSNTSYLDIEKDRDIISQRYVLPDITSVVKGKK